MLNIELKKRIPQDHAEIDIHWVIKTFQHCRALFVSADEEQCAMVRLDGNSVSPGYTLLIHYKPSDTHLRLQLFGSFEGHDPVRSYLCYPDKISERVGYITGDREPYERIHRPYVNVIDGSYEWKVVQTNAIRKLRHLDRESVPATRSHLIEELRALINQHQRKIKDGDYTPSDVTRSRNRAMALEQFLICVKLSGFNQAELSYPFINNYRDNYVWITQGLATMLDPKWDEDVQLSMIKTFMAKIDPTVAYGSDVPTEASLETMRGILTRNTHWQISSGDGYLPSKDLTVEQAVGVWAKI